MGSRGENLDITVVYLTVGFLLMAVFIVIFIGIYRKRLNTFINDKVELKYRFEQTLLQTQLEIQEQTLKNISQEIHDNVGQVLSLAKLNLNTMDISKTEQLQGKIDSTLSQVSKAINDLRDLSKSFNTDNITAIGLVRAIEYELDMIRKTDSHQAVLHVTGNVLKLEPQKELILFRIVQEALHNIIKHAGAGVVNVSATYTDKELQLLVTDDGNGFDLTPLNIADNNSFGLGIRNMHNRAKLIGADFQMSSTIGEGTLVKIVLPFNQQTSTP